MSKYTIDPEIAARLDVSQRLFDLIFEISDLHDGDINAGVGRVLGQMIRIIRELTGSLDEAGRIINGAIDTMQEIENGAKTGLKNLH